MPYVSMMFSTEQAAAYIAASGLNPCDVLPELVMKTRTIFGNVYYILSDLDVAIFQNKKKPPSVEPFLSHDQKRRRAKKLAKNMRRAIR